MQTISQNTTKTESIPHYYAVLPSGTVLAFTSVTKRVTFEYRVATPHCFKVSSRSLTAKQKRSAYVVDTWEKVEEAVAVYTKGQERD